MKHLTQKSKFMRMFTGLAVFGAMAFGAMACDVDDDPAVEDDPIVEEEPADPAEEPEDDPFDDDDEDDV